MITALLWFLILTPALAFQPICMMREGGIEAVGGCILTAFDLVIAYHSGKAALWLQREFIIPHPLCGFGMIAAALASCAVFNLSAMRLWSEFWKAWI